MNRIDKWTRWTSYFSVKFNYRTNRRSFSYILLLLTISVIVILNRNHSNLPIKSINSDQCNCSRQIDSTANNANEFTWCNSDSLRRGKHQKVVTFSLFANAEDSTVSQRYSFLLNNISQSIKNGYDDWLVRIYHNIDRNSRTYRHLCRISCQFDHVDLCSMAEIIQQIGNGNNLPIESKLLSNLNPRFYRFLVAFDSNVDVFVSRDLDSPVLRREIDAVNQWIRSNYTFHLMRDHEHHDAIILAGMWGAKLDRRRDLLEGLMRILVIAGQTQKVYQDQVALESIIWPVAKYDVMAHDSYQCQNREVVDASAIKVFPFPTRRDGDGYVGGIVDNHQKPSPCPEACRPPNHPDWEFC